MVLKCVYITIFAALLMTTAAASKLERRGQGLKAAAVANQPQDGIHPILFFPESTNTEPISSQLEDEAAEELQEEIDRLRKLFKELKAQMESSTSSEALEKIHEKMSDLQVQLDKQYKKLEEVSKELQEQLKEKIDELSKEIVALNNELSDRVTALENQIEQNSINSVIGFIRQETLHEMALATFKNIRKPLLAIPRIIKESFKNDVEKCPTVLKFIVDVHVDTTDQRLLNEIKSSAYTTFYDQLREHESTDAGSDCLFKMAYQAFKVWETLNTWEEKAKSQFRILFENIPSGVEAVIRPYSYHIRKDQSGCQFSSPQEEQAYKDGKYVGDNTFFEADTPDEGDYFFLKGPAEQPLEGSGNNNVFLGMPSGNDNPNQLWKIRISYKNKIVIKHKVTGKLLYWEQVGNSCYKYKLDDKWLLSWSVTP